MNWNKLENINHLNVIDEESKGGKVLILKHSTRCGISSTVVDRFERNWKDADSKKMKPYFLDLLAHRDISNEIANRYKVVHESPQVLLIENGVCTYHTSQLDITCQEILKH